jgi:hypothetical protein
MKLAMLVLWAVLLLGCGGDNVAPTDAAVSHDASTPVDASIPEDASAPDDAASPGDSSEPGDGAPGDAGAACVAAASYGDLGTRTDAVEADDLAAPTIVWATFALNADPDTLKVDLYQGIGVFATSIHAGTFPLTGDELSYATCGACVHLTTTGAGGVTQDYMATGGTLTITAVAPRLQAVLADVAFEHVTIAGSESTPVSDGCVSAISQVVIDSPLSVE